MNIPKIIHQTWKDNIVPQQFLASVESWKTLHPGWEYKLWTDEMCYVFIQENFKEFLPIYENYSKSIQRADAIRYFLLFFFGGIYVDLDFHCFKNITPLLEENDCVFGMENIQHTHDHQKDKIISNAFMASRKGSKFIESICNELFKSHGQYFLNENDFILESTGPFMLTRVYDQYLESNGTEKLNLLSSSVLYPLPKYDINDQVLIEIKKGQLDDRLVDSYGIHYYWGSWWKNK